MGRLRWLIVFLPLVMAMGIQDDEEEEGGMGGTGHKMEIPTDIPDTPELPELIESLPNDLDMIELDDVSGGNEVDVEAPECMD